MAGYFGIHNHTEYSNFRLLDSINKPIALINKAIELGLTGIAITDHETLSAHMIVNQYAKKLQETNPDFTIALGNEIYLTDTRDRGQKYYHFILIAKDAIGHKALRELSSIAWYNSYEDRGMERVPLLKTELAETMEKYRGHVIATTACLGGELSTNALAMAVNENNKNVQLVEESYLNIKRFMKFCLDVFGEDFYIECAPAATDDQIITNRKLQKIAKAYNVKMVVGTDAHYLTKNDRLVHKAYLKSKPGDREVDSFYEFSYLMDKNEAMELLSLSFDDKDFIETILNNTIEIQNKIEFYSLEHHQSIPEVQVHNYEKSLAYFGINNSRKDELDSRWPITKSLFLSDNIQERYWINQCYEALIEKGLFDDDRYLDRLEEEANTKRIIGEKLQTCMFAYPNTL